MIEALQGITLLAATITTGLMAGVFGLYAHTIMPGLGRTDDRTFVGAFQAIDRAIINPWFVPVFIGALVLTAVAAALSLGEERRDVLPWAIAAFVLYLPGFIATLRFNVPLNNAIKAAGTPDQVDDLAGVRERFDEPKWARWNLFRTIGSTAAFGCLAWALVEFGRTL
jgi:uncharacterized membrane protein